MSRARIGMSRNSPPQLSIYLSTIPFPRLHDPSTRTSSPRVSILSDFLSTSSPCCGRHTFSRRQLAILRCLSSTGPIRLTKTPSIAVAKPQSYSLLI